MWVAEAVEVLSSGTAQPPLALALENSPFAASGPEVSKASPSSAAAIFPTEVGAASLLQLVELVLKDRPALERLIREHWLQAKLVPRLLTISVVSFVLYAAAMTTFFHAADVWPRLAPVKSFLAGDAAVLIEFDRGPAMGTMAFQSAALHLTLAYAVGLIAATGICLPSLYFYGLLAGVRMSLLDVVIHALKAKATAAIALVGLLPIYAAGALAMIVFGITGWQRDVTLMVGMLLPFFGGFWGTWSLYRGFLGLADTMPADRRCRRQCFLRRLVVAWSACYTAVSPLMIYTLWEYLQRS